MHPSHRNQIVSSLSQSAQELLRPHLSPVDLPVRFPLWTARKRPEFAYFLTSGLASVVTSFPDGGTAEVEMIGREGVAGAIHLMGRAPAPTDCFMQLEGTGQRLELAVLQALYDDVPEIRIRIGALLQVQALTTCQIAGCNALHEVEARLARWLLMAQDRTGEDVLPFTQEFLAEMMGSRRTTVTMVAGALQRSGLIEYRRGRITLLDRGGLEEAACDCYQIARSLFRTLQQELRAPVVWAEPGSKELHRVS